MKRKKIVARPAGARASSYEEEEDDGSGRSTAALEC